jgi:hypothetical protein
VGVDVDVEGGSRGSQKRALWREEEINEKQERKRNEGEILLDTHAGWSAIQPEGIHISVDA